MNSSFNCDIYRKKLSPLGCSVLNIMVRRWKEERNRIVEYRHTNNIRVRDRKVLTFGDFDSVEQNSRENNSLALRNVNHTAHSSENFPTNTFDDRPSMKPVMSPENTTLSDTISKEILNNRQDLNKATEILKSLYDDDLDIEKQQKYTQNEVSVQNEYKMAKDPDQVKWDDMFDTEMFTSPTTASTLKTAEIKMVSPEISKTTNDAEEKRKVMIISNQKLSADVLKTAKKRKCNPKDNGKTTKNKIKKVEDKSKQEKAFTPNFKKEKYKTVVKKWLGNIQPPEACRSAGPQPAAGAAASLAQTDRQDNLPQKATVATLTVEKASKNKEKKSVQAQLANKDGVMKYKKPKSPIIMRKKCEEIDENKNQTTAKTDKKSKPKFVPPLKSQASQASQPAVEDNNVTYNIADVNDENIKDLFYHKPDKEGVLLVLVYSNGFCQLNSQYTEDSCEAEGLLINYNESYFYVKHEALANKTVAGELLSSLMKNVEVIMYEGKNVLIYLADHYDTSVEDSQLVDVKIGCCLLEPDDPPAHFVAAARALGAAAGAGGAAAGAAGVAAAGGCALQRAAGGAVRLRGAAARLRQRLRADELWELFTELEMQVLPVIADMQRRGVRAEPARLRGMAAALAAEERAAAAAVRAAAGRDVPVRSGPRLRALLYDELRLDAHLRVRPTAATGAKSTDEATLRALAAGGHALPGAVLQYRQAHKARATFVAGVARRVRGGRVRPVWEQMAAATGRVSCTSPNLQAIPRAPFSLRLSAEPGAPVRTLHFRSAYCARRGRTLLAADWRLLECRVFAHLARDAVLQRALAGPDLFTTLAARWLGGAAAAAPAAARERTKRVVYAALYGAGPRALAGLLQEPPERARALLASFYEAVPSLRSFGARAAAACAAAGGRVRSLRGRARRLPHVASADPARRARAQRQAVNFLVQGSAADLCKTAMVSTARALRGAAAGGAGGGAAPARLVLQIHDELVWEVDTPQLASVARVVRRAMEAAGAACGLPALPVRLAAGADWAALQPYDPDDPRDPSDPGIAADADL